MGRLRAEGTRGRERLTRGSDIGRRVCLGVRTRAQMNPDLCTAISEIGSLDYQPGPPA